MTDSKRGWAHEYEVTVKAPSERVFAALTDPAELTRWFAEAVEVEPRKGGAYAFWGRHTLGTPAREAARQRITRFEPGKALAFEWRMEDSDSEVTLLLTPKPAEAGEPDTIVAVRHAFSDKPKLPYAAELVDDLWRLSLGNLDAHLRGGAGIVLPDYADPNPEIRVSIVIDAPRERVFQALVTPAAMNRWVASAAEVDPRIGGAYKYGWKYQVDGCDVEGGPTRILDLVPNQRLVTDWTDWRGDETRPSTRVAWILEDAGAGTRVTLVHDGFSRTADLSDYPFGWSSFLAQLKAEAESGN